MRTISWDNVQEQSEPLLSEGARALLSVRPVAWREAKMPDKAGIYVVRDSIGKLVYVGISKSLKRRRMNHCGKNYRKSALRQSIGEKLLGFDKPFGKNTEEQISEYLNTCSVAYLTLTMGRIELEEYVCREYDILLNKLK